MFNSNEDDDLFTPSASSNLANLFGSVVSSSTDLKYTAPRQPKSDSDLKDSSEAPQVSVICAKVVITKKFVDPSYQDLGKYGFAIVGNRDFIKEMLLYKDKHHVISKITVSKDFNVSHVDVDVLSFYDDQGGRWETKFIKVEDFQEFVKILKTRNVGIVDKLSRIEIVDKDIPDNPKEESFDSHIRTDILTRMAKMGQSVLPGKLVKTSTGSDSETDDNTVTKRKPVVKKKPNHTNSIISQSEGSADANPPPVLYQMQPYNYSQPQIHPQTLNMPYPSSDLNFFLSENRTHNSEVRINLTTISGKIDTILNEIYRIKTPANTDKLENEYLKSKIIDLEAKLSKSSLPSLDQSLQLKEMENLLLTKSNRISELDKTVLMLEASLNEASITGKSVEELKLENELLSNKINELNLKIKNIEEESTISQQNFVQLQNLHDNITQENKRLLENNQLLKDTLDNNETKACETNINPNEIKQIMNGMFQSILQDFNEDSPATYKEIKSSLAKHLKTATFAMIDKLQMGSE